MSGSERVKEHGGHGGEEEVFLGGRLDIISELAELFLEEGRTDTNVSLKLDFVSQKKRAWPSRPCGN